MAAVTSIENNFTKGLVTEFTGLNFPENAATDTDNCVYTLVGDVTRRQGINVENNASYANLTSVGKAYNSYKWNNAGGDGTAQLVVVQTGTNLTFYKSSIATNTTGISGQAIQVVSILPFATGLTPDPSISECQFADGNGYLFVYHPSCDPFYCTYINGVVTPNLITVQIRDFVGLNDGFPVNTRPATALNNTAHTYNLLNQGWLSGNPWSATSASSYSAGVVGLTTFIIQTGVSVTVGQTVNILYNGPNTGHGLPPPGTVVATGAVTGYTSGTGSLIINISSTTFWTGTATSWLILPIAIGYINTFLSATGSYPSNADVWWYFKNASGVFDPATTLNNVTLSAGNAPKGHFVLSAFNQDRTAASASGNVYPTVSTTVRPKTGTWFQGRVWYTGVDSSFAGSGIVPFSTWSENIYFSQIITDSSQFGQCYQVNDPTSETLFGLLPTDGGVITIQGCGSIYKLFAMQNALLVFASNGVWYITGSQGIGFSANDYTIVKLSSVQSISSTSFVDVNGLPYFWNEEGIYAVEPAKQGTSLLNSPLHVNPLEVSPLTIGTILTFYNSIPAESKRYARGAYHPLDYIIQWTFRSTSDGDDVNLRYQYDRILNFNTSNKAFYPYTITGTPKINGIIYVSYPPTSTTPDPSFKYITTVGASLTFSEERDTNYIDWFNYDNKGVDYNSFFVTGYKVHGQGQRRFQVPYIYVFSKNVVTNAYKIQGIWDYAANKDSGRWSTPQLVLNVSNNFGMKFRRHVIRGRGLVLQLKVSSVSGEPFDIVGWSTYETQNVGV